MWKTLCESAICLLTKLPQCGKYANKTSTKWKVLSRKLPQCGKFTKLTKTSTMWKQNYKENHISNLIFKDSYTEL